MSPVNSSIEGPGNPPIISNSAPQPNEVYVKPPNTPTPTTTQTPEFLPPPGEEAKPVDPNAKKEFKIDATVLLRNGTLGDMVKNLHHGVAIATDFKGWELEPDEVKRFDDTLGVMLAPLLEDSKYLGLVLGILSLATIEGTHIGAYLQHRKKTAPTPPPPAAPGASLPNVPGVAQPVPGQITPTPTEARELGKVENELGLPPSPGTAMSRAQAGTSIIQGDLGLPPASPRATARVPPSMQ